MFEGVRKSLTVLIAIIALIGFVYFFGTMIVGALFTSQPPAFTPDQVTLATILSGLVGGIVAAGFGQKLPGGNSRGNPIGIKVSALGGFVQGGLDWTSKELIGSIYAAVYVILGLLAIYIAYFRPNVAPDLLRNLANVTLGLFIAILTAFFSPT